MSYGLNINKGTHAKLQGFRELIEGFITGQADKNAYENEQILSVSPVSSMMSVRIRRLKT